MARAEGLREYSFQHPRRDDDRRREYDSSPDNSYSELAVDFSENL
jgi:hypothetical protein